jgi:acyl-CoA thioester hydrolase
MADEQLDASPSPSRSAGPTTAAAPYRVNVPLRWSDMDAYGHVNNVQFLRLLEDARVIGFEEWFGQDRSVLADGILVARHEIEYLAPLLFRVPPIVVEMWATRIGGGGFDLAYEVRDGAGRDATVYARAETTLVLYDFATSRPRRMDTDLRRLLEAHAGEPVRFRWRRR